MVLRRVNARAVQACPVFCTRRNLRKKAIKKYTTKYESMLSSTVMDAHFEIMFCSEEKGRLCKSEMGLCPLKK